MPSQSVSRKSDKSKTEEKNSQNNDESVIIYGAKEISTPSDKNLAKRSAKTPGEKSKKKGSSSESFSAGSFSSSNKSITIGKQKNKSPENSATLGAPLFKSSKKARF